jgi:hypothetical protein
MQAPFARRRNASTAAGDAAAELVAVGPLAPPVDDPEPHPARTAHARVAAHPAIVFALPVPT